MTTTEFFIGDPFNPNSYGAVFEPDRCVLTDDWWENSYYIHQFARGLLAFQLDTLPCYECSDFKPPYIERKVVKLGPIIDRADPTQTYILECGHRVI